MGRAVHSSEDHNFEKVFRDCVDWQMVTDVSGEPAEYSYLEDGDNKLPWNNGNYLPNDMVS